MTKKQNKKFFKIEAHEIKKIIAILTREINSFNQEKLEKCWREIDRLFSLFKIKARFFANKVDYFLQKTSEGEIEDHEPSRNS